MERAAQLIEESRAEKSAANTPIKSFEQEPELLVKNGRYGAYIAYKGKNYKIPKGCEPEQLTIEDCMKIIESSKKSK